MTLQNTLRKKIFQTLAEGKSFSIYKNNDHLKIDDFTMAVLREMEEEGLIVSEPDGTYKIKN